MNGFLLKAHIAFLNLLFYAFNGILEIIRKILWIRKRPTQVMRVCIYRIGNIGDIVCAIPAMHRIRKAYPHSHLTLLTSPGKRGMVGAKELLEGADWLDDIVVYYSDQIDNKVKLYKWLITLKKKQFDTWIELPKQLATMRSTINNMITARFVCRNWGYGWRINTIKFGSKTQSEYFDFPNEVERISRIITEAGIPEENPFFNLPVNKSHREAVDLLLDLNELGEKPLVALAPGAKCSINRWPAERFAELGRFLESQGFITVILAGKNDENLCESILREMKGGGINFAGKSSLLETAEILRRCHLLVCNDSGVQHLASAVGTPCISLFSYRDIKGKWRPYGKENIVIQKWVDCHSCYLVSCPYDNKCIKLIEVNEVINAVKLRLGVKISIDV